MTHASLMQTSQCRSLIKKSWIDRMRKAAYVALLTILNCWIDAVTLAVVNFILYYLRILV